MAAVDLVHVGKKYESCLDVRIPWNSAHFIRKTGSEKNDFRIEDLSLHVPDGKTFVILGPSGCGKSTLLKLMAGILNPDSGEVLYDGRNITEIPASERGIGMVFQNYALYPHFTSKENILSYYFFRKNTASVHRIAEEKLKRTSSLMDVPIEYLLDRKPDKLSGGERQRVAVGRCITRDPTLFLMDEPFSNLDQPLRQKYRTHLKRLLNEFGITSVYVTHDHQEAIILADLIAVMRDGKIEQTGTYGDLYDNPVNLFTAEFLNPRTDVPAINVLSGERLVPALEGKTAGIRPQDIEFTDTRGEGQVRGHISSIDSLPFSNELIVHFQAEDTHLTAVVRPGEKPDPVPGPTSVRFRKIHLFDAGTGERLETVFT